MRKIVPMLFAFISYLIGFAVAFIQVFLFAEKRINHSGKQTFRECTRSVAIEVKLRFNHWLSMLQHSPTLN